MEITSISDHEGKTFFSSVCNCGNSKLKQKKAELQSVQRNVIKSQACILTKQLPPKNIQKRYHHSLCTRWRVEIMYFVISVPFCYFQHCFPYPRLIKLFFLKKKKELLRTKVVISHGLQNNLNW